MRIMGLDVGSKTIGVAVSDLLGITAQGVETIRRRDEETDLQHLKTLIEQYEVTKVCIGLPRNMDGSFGPQAEMVREFGRLIGDTFGLPVVYWDERLTTMEAERSLLEADLSRKKRRKVIDKMAAVLILQGYLDSRQHKI